MQIVPTLNFAGCCREAIQLYAQAFGGEITTLVTYRDAGDPDWTSRLREDQLDWIYHAELLLAGQRIIMSDHADLALGVCYSNFLTVMLDSAEEVRRAYALMERGSTTIYPIASTPYSACRVVFVDRFGIRWGIMTERVSSGGPMHVTLDRRTAETVRTNFERCSAPEILRTLPRKAQSVEEALADYEKTLLPGATSYGRIIRAEGRYVGDVWCYGIDPADEPGCMLSFCVFEPDLWGQGVASAAVALFLQELRARLGPGSIGAFTFADNVASRRVLEKCGFALVEAFEEDGVPSLYLQREL